jgi:tetratricopeptide (TPR) repeat protein
MANINRSTIIKQRAEGVTLLEQQAFKEAEPYLRDALELTLEQRNAETFMLMQRLAESLIGQGKYAEAEGLAQKAQNGFKRFGSDDEDMLDCQCLLAECLCAQRKHSEAVELAQKALDGLEANMKRGPDHATTMRCRSFLAASLKGQCKFQDAMALAKYNWERLEAVKIKAETNANTGSRKLSHFERSALVKVEAMTVKVLGEENVKPKRTATIESVSTATPQDSDSEPSSRVSSQQNSRVPSKELVQGCK